MKRWLKPALIAAAGPFLIWGGHDYYQLQSFQSDLTRALTPVRTLSLSEVQQRQTASIEFSWPSDPQWQRISERWESPKFFLAGFKLPQDPKGEYVRLPVDPLSLKVFRDGIEVTPLPWSELCTYPEFVPGAAYLTSFSGLLFRAEPGARLRIEATCPKGQSLPEGLLATGPYLRGGLVKDAMIEGLVRSSIANGKIGIAVVLIAVTLLLVYLERRRSRRLEASGSRK